VSAQTRDHHQEREEKEKEKKAFTKNGTKKLKLKI